MLSDDRLARLVSAGDDRAFATLYSRFHQPLYRYCQSMVRHDADSQDALQSTFASALVALRRGQRDAPVRPWLFRIAHNESISLLRKRRPTGELSETIEAPMLSVEAAADERQRLAQLVADLQELPERQRGALVMRELNGLSHVELAEALGISLGAAKQTVFEARRALAEFEEGRAMACEQIQRVISDGDGRALRGRKVRAHLRECSGCSAFATAIPQRRAALMALSPALPAATAAGLFTRITGAGGGHHGGGGLLAGAASKGVGAAVSSKALLTGVAIVATAASTAGIVKVVTSSGHRPSPLIAHRGADSGAASGSPASSAGSLAARSVSSSHSALGSAPATHTTSGAGSRKGTAGSGSHKATRAAAVSPTTLRSGVPSAGSGRSGGQTAGNGQSTSNPNAHGGNPNAGGTNSGSGSSNPNAHGGNPNAHGGNPNAHGGNSNSGGGNAGGASNPNAHGGNPNAHGGNPNAGRGSANAHGGNPNAAGGNDHR